VASIQVPGLEVDVPYRAQYNWLSHDGLRGAAPVAARVASIRLGEHHGFVVINRRLKATPEHPFMIRRNAPPPAPPQWGFTSAEFVQPGDFLIDEHLNEEEVESVVRVDAPARTVAIHIPGTNTLLAEGVWVHNDMPATVHSGSGSGSSSGSGSGSNSGSSSGSTSGSSGSGSSSGSKSSGSSSFSSSGSSSGSGSESMSSSSQSGGGSTVVPL